MKLVTQQVLVVLSLVCVSIVLVGTLSYSLEREVVINERLDELDFVNQLEVEEITNFYEERVLDLKESQGYANLKRNLPILTSNSSSEDAIADAMAELDSQFQVLTESKDYYQGVYLLGLAGEIIYRFNREEELADEFLVGLDKLCEGGIPAVKVSDIYDLSIEKNVYKVLGAAPHIDQDGNILGTIVFDINMERAFGFRKSDGWTSFESYAGVLMDNEYTKVSFSHSPLIQGNFVYVIDPDAEITNESSRLFSSNTTYPISKAVVGEEGRGIVVDHNGNKVLATWRPIPGSNMGLVTSSNFAATIAPVNKLGWQVFFFSLLVILISTGIAIYFAKTITQPLVSLIDYLQEFFSGKRRKKLEFRQDSEIGELGRAFIRLSQQVKKANRDNRKKHEALKKIVADLEKEKKISDVKTKKLQKMRKTLLNNIKSMKRSRKTVDTTNKKLLEAQRITKLGSWEWNVKKDHFTGTDQFFILLGLKGKKASNYSDISQLIVAQDRKKVSKCINRAIKRGKPFSIEFGIRRGEEKRFVRVHGNVESLRNGQVTAYLGTMQDITRSKEVDALKDELISIASHELKTPLTSITSLTELMLDDGTGKINKKQREILSMVLKDAEKLYTLIESMLDVSRIEKGTIAYDFNKFNLTGLISETVDMTRSLAQTKKIKLNFEYNKKLLVEADRLRIGQVLMNLLTNAVKYGKTNGGVNISLQAKKDQVVVSVADDGIGISKKDQNKVFEKMFQIDQTNRRKTGGVGFGLYLSKKIVEEGHKGKIWVQSSKNEGSTFYFSLPLKKVSKRIVKPKKK